MDTLGRITVNGKEQKFLIEADLSLLVFLRESLGLTGTKNGCSGKGHCGACTVIVNGEAKRSCVLKLNKIDGSIVETIESLYENNKFHPIQQAFIDEGAVQCGFCTPGMIMSTKALLDKNPNPSDVEIKEGLKNNYCRCTGYAAIMKAVKRASDYLKNGMTPLKEGQLSNTHTQVRKDVPKKVCGTSIYADDIYKKDVIHGKLLFTEYPHADIVSIDRKEAEKLDGVILILIAEDIPGKKIFGLHVPQQPILVENRAKYIGDPIAVVYAESEAIAEAAVKLIKVEYKPLPGIFSADEAMAEDSLRIHDEPNIRHHIKVRKGNIEEAFKKADIIIEGEYFTPSVEHAYMEAESCVSLYDDVGDLVVYTGSQSSQSMQKIIAASLDIPLEKVRVILTTTGGAFGGKEEPTIQIHCALGTLKTGRPVKMTLTREESIRISTKRHAEHIYMKHGATRDGKIIAFESKAICDIGAYISLSGAVVFRSAVVAAGPYDIPNANADSLGVYTNNNPGGAFRGFGSTQVTFASEIQMDKLAVALNMDPFEIRELNSLEKGKTTITGQVLKDGVANIEILDAVKELIQNKSFRASNGKKIGIGLAGSYKNVGIGTGKPDGAGAEIELMPGGRILAKIGATENGQGSDTAMAVIASRELNIDYYLVDILSSDTKYTPDAGDTTASRQTFVSGNAVKGASADFLKLLKNYAATLLNIEVAEIIHENDKFYDKNKKNSVDLGGIYDASKKLGEVIKAFYYYNPPETFPLRPSAEHVEGTTDHDFDIHYAYCFGAQVAVVEVDMETADVKVLKVFAAQDAGSTIHEMSIRGQVEGAIAMGFGYAMQENFIQKDGYIINNNLLKLRVPMIKQMPEIEVAIVEKPQLSGPFGAKGMGEVPVNPTAPAIINAIHDATGIWLNKIPFDREVLLSEMKKLNKEKS